MTVTYHTGHVLDHVRALPDNSIDLVTTSPPFLALRDYNGHEGQWGSEPDPASFLDHLLELTVELRRVLAPHGSIAIELGDTYSGSGGAGGDYNADGLREGQAKFSGSASKQCAGAWPLPKSLCGTPTLYAWSLAYGRNLLRPDHTITPWLVRNVIVWARCLDGDTVVYARTPKGDGPARLLHLTQNWRPGQWQLWDGQRWTDVLGWEATESTDAIEIEFRNGERVNATRNHRWPTARGLVTTADLVVGDVVPTVQLPEPAMPLDPSGLPDEMIGWFVGMYLAEGSLDSRGRIQITGHRDEAEHRLSRLRELAEAYHGTATVHAYATQAATVVVRSEVLRGVLARYIDGKNARTKHLAPACWQRSNAFLRALVQGYLDGDGGYDAKNDRWRLGFTDNPWLARDLRVACARIGATCRLRRVKRYADDRTQFAGASSFIWRGEIRFGFASTAHQRPDGQIVALRASKRRRFFDVTVEGEPHLFALGSGILTHNSNPPVGALGDKVRPATSYITVATPSASRWFDLDAVRTPVQHPHKTAPNPHNISDKGVSGAGLKDYHGSMSAGAPPLDHWHDEPDGDLLWLINTQGSSLAHYAMWPPKLVERLILSMCPAHVCRTCGEPRRRITGPAEYVDGRGRPRPAFKWSSGMPEGRGAHNGKNGISGMTAVAPTLGWSDCGCGPGCVPATWEEQWAPASYRDDGKLIATARSERVMVDPGSCDGSHYRPGHVLDPFAGTGTTLAVADIHGRDATGIDLDPVNPKLYPTRYAQCWQALKPDAGVSPVTDHGEQLNLMEHA